jgi:hypothetical protein
VLEVTPLESDIAGTSEARIWAMRASPKARSRIVSERYRMIACNGLEIVAPRLLQVHAAGVWTSHRPINLLVRTIASQATVPALVMTPN